jgi:diguanylate cyclase (GGDEF)-like protein
VADEIPVGLVTERDIVRIAADLADGRVDVAEPVARYMSQPVIAINANATLEDALVVSKSKNIRHLPIDNADRKLVGLVTQSDLITAQSRFHRLQAKVFESEIMTLRRESVNLNHKLLALAQEDPLLGIANLRAMENDLQQIHAISSRYHRPYTVMILGIDGFDEFQGRFGHSSAECALEQISGFFKGAIRAADRLYRYGPYKFLILLPETLRDGAEALARRLMDGVVELAIAHEEHSMGVLTASAVVNSRAEWFGDESWHDIVDATDEALHQAMKIGNNRIVMMAPSKPFDPEAVAFQGLIPRQ